MRNDELYIYVYKYIYYIVSLFSVLLEVNKKA